MCFKTAAENCWFCLGTLFYSQIFLTEVLCGRAFVLFKAWKYSSTQSVTEEKKKATGQSVVNDLLENLDVW